MRRVDEPRSLEDLIAAAAGWNAGRPLFASRAEKRRALNAGYPLYLRLSADSGAAVEALLSHDRFPSRQRLPSRSNLALIVVLLVAKPEDKAERRICSDYAALYDYALAHEVYPADFLDRMAKVTLEEASRYVRSVKAAQKPASTDPADLPLALHADGDKDARQKAPLQQDEKKGRIEIVVQSADGSTTTAKRDLSAGTSAKLRAVLEEIPPECDAHAVLTRLSIALNFLKVLDAGPPAHVLPDDARRSDRVRAAPAGRTLRVELPSLSPDVVRTRWAPGGRRISLSLKASTKE